MRRSPRPTSGGLPRARHAVLALAAALAVPSAGLVAAEPPATRTQAVHLTGQQSTAQQRDAAVERRIDALLARMTLDEKLGQLQQLDADYPTGRLTAEQLQMVREGRLGSTLNGRGAKNTNDAQRVAVEESRLGIPLIFGFDVIHGYRTVFPMPMAEASTFDPDDAETSAAIAAKEARAAGVTWTFAPMLDIARDARWGRIVEGAGEDPYLGSVFAEARVTGFQGDDYSAPDRVAATAKHWVAYGGAEAGRDYNTVDVSEQRLRELYFPPFKAAVDAGVDSFMTSFNEISGVPATANPFVLDQVLRDEWKEDGPVLSDYTAVAELVNHGVAADGKDAARLALNAGTDVEMVSRLFNQHGKALVDEGAVPMSRIDEAVRRVLRLKFRAGLFENPYVDESRESRVLLADAHVRQARRIAARSMVLLRNQGGALPLAPDLGRIAVIGGLANSKADMLGTWTGDGKASDAVTILDGIRGAAPGSDVTYAEGCSAECTSESGFAQAVAAAEAADVSVVVLGEPAGWSGEASSRSRIDLPGRQLDLLQEVDRTGKPYVVVLANGRPLELGWLDEHAPAVLEAWYPGTQAGHAVADVLFGKVNPGGKLPVSFPRSVGQLPLAYNHKNTGRPPADDNKYTSKYLDVPVTPLYPFGHGLSYTSFALSGLTLSSSTISPDGKVKVTATVANTGERAGDEVVQLYVRDKVASVTRPVRELKGFERVSLEPGASTRVTFTLDREALSFWNVANEKVVEPGEFDVWVGTSSVGGLHDTFRVTG